MLRKSLAAVALLGLSAMANQQAIFEGEILDGRELRHRVGGGGPKKPHHGGGSKKPHHGGGGKKHKKGNLDLDLNGEIT